MLGVICPRSRRTSGTSYTRSRMQSRTRSPTWPRSWWDKLRRAWPMLRIRFNTITQSHRIMRSHSFSRKSRRLALISARNLATLEWPALSRWTLGALCCFTSALWRCSLAAAWEDAWWFLSPKLAITRLTPASTLPRWIRTRSSSRRLLNEAISNCLQDHSRSMSSLSNYRSSKLILSWCRLGTWARLRSSTSSARRTVKLLLLPQRCPYHWSPLPMRKLASQPSSLLISRAIWIDPEIEEEWELWREPKSTWTATKVTYAITTEEMLTPSYLRDI